MDTESAHAWSASASVLARHVADRATDGGSVRICEVLPAPSAKLRYTYDLGDQWRHEVTLQKILPAHPSTAFPVCSDRFEDSGGSWAP